MKILTQISRLIIGLVFVYSGFVKLVDPMGTKFKMIEYFGEDVLNMEFFIPFALPISMLLILAELILGLMLLLGFKQKFTIYSIFLLSTVFLFLTWYSHKYQVVTDCGCFGDAIKLTTAETFYKNIFFTGLILILIKGIKQIKSVFSEKISAILVVSISILSIATMFYSLKYLPIIDFRAYSIGTNISEGMKFKEGIDAPPIHDFMIDTDEGDKLQEVLNEEKVLLVIMYSFETAEKESFPEIAKVAKTAEEKGYKVYILTDMPEEYLPKTPTELGLPFKFASCDATALKTAIRTNPGIMTIEKGTIVGKWSWQDSNNIKLK